MKTARAVGNLPRRAKLRDAWLTEDQAKSLGVSIWLLITYSDSDDPRRKKAGQPHPLLGRMIRTRWRDRRSGQRQVRERLYRRKDLDELKRKEESFEPPAGMISVAEAVILSGRSRTQLMDLINRDKLAGKKINAVKSNGRPLPKWFVPRKAIEAMPAAPKPGPTKRRRKNRGQEDEDGVWWPLREATQLSEETAGNLCLWRTTPCPYLGRTLRSKEMRITLYRSKHGPFTFVYHDADLRCIRDRKRGRAAPVPETGVTCAAT